MKLYTVWIKKGFVGINEKCLLNADDDYIGQKTGRKYSKDEHYHSQQINAQIIKADTANNTGMCHLWKDCWSDETKEDNRKSWKEKYMGCYVTVEEAHWFGEHRVYRCLELGEYFSDDELLILDRI